MLIPKFFPIIDMNAGTMYSKVQMWGPLHCKGPSPVVPNLLCA